MSASGRSANRQIFINIPYDAPYEPLFLALIAGLVTLDFTPVATLLAPESPGRLQRILRLIRESPFSIHDLSRVECSLTEARGSRLTDTRLHGLAEAVEAVFARQSPRGERGLPTESKRLRRRVLSLIAAAQPRFNMPFELGLTVAWREMEKERLLGGREPRTAREEARLPQYRILEAVDHRHRQTLSDLGGTDAYVHRGSPAGILKALASAFPFELADTEEMSFVHRHLSAYRRDGLAAYPGVELYAARPFGRLVAAACELRDIHRATSAPGEPR